MSESRLVTPCCRDCTHGPSSPCSDLLECIDHGPVCHSDDACRSARAARRARVARGGDGLAVFVGSGTCGRAGGALTVVDAIRRYVADAGLDVPVVETGCLGYCEREVFVDLVTADGMRLSYCDLGPDTIAEWLEAVFVRNELANPFLLGRYDDPGGRYPDLPALADTPFFAAQTRVVLGNCGVIDPSLARRGAGRRRFSRAVAKALTAMTPAEVSTRSSPRACAAAAERASPRARSGSSPSRQSREQKYVICNADEGDPGAFMDRACSRATPSA